MIAKPSAITILIGFLVFWVPHVASGAVPTELEDLQESLDTCSARDSYSDSCQAGNVCARDFRPCTLISDNGSHRIIYTDRDCFDSHARHGGRELIVKIDGNGLLEIQPTAPCPGLIVRQEAFVSVFCRDHEQRQVSGNPTRAWAVTSGRIFPLGDWTIRGP